MYLPLIVIVSAMYSEIERFAERLPLAEVISFPLGVQSLMWNESHRILGLVTGEGVRKGSISVMALGMDPRFDTSSSYWLFCGIAGVDPVYGSLGSAFWATHAIHADWGYMFDAREIPPEWHGITVVPEGRKTPFQAPTPSRLPDTIAFDLQPFALWAYNLTKHLVIPDNLDLQSARKEYSPNSPAGQKPAVRLGAVVAGDFYWAGRYMTAFYRKWHRYWLNVSVDTKQFPDLGLATTAMEDTAVVTALHTLQNASLANASRLAILRTASDYSHQPDDQDLFPWFFSDSRMSATTPALEAAYLVARPVIDTLLRLNAADTSVAPNFHEGMRPI